MTDNKVTVSAPGKLMIMGEHAVVYGHPCLVTTVARRLTVTVEVAGERGVAINAPQSTDTRFVQKAIETAHAYWKTPDQGLKITTESPFTNSYGFGSSSAVTVATLYALLRIFGVQATMQELFKASYETVLAVQGVGSGFDVAAAVFGGTLHYVAGGKVMDPLRFRRGQPRFVIGYTKVKANSVDIVRDVAHKYQEHQEKMDRIFAAVSDLVVKGREAFESGDWERAGKLMDFNQEYLRDIGVSTEKLETLISSAKKAGALGAKLSGAGGGDCMIALVTPNTADAVSDAIGKAGGEVVAAATGVSGVTHETGDGQDERFVVVDENDQVIGVRTRGECHADPSLIHRAAGVAVFDREGRILLQRRSLTKDTDPGAWGLSSAGHVMEGEDYGDAAGRELKEELGVELPLTYRGTYLFRGTHESEMDAVFSAVSDGPFNPDPGEVAEVRFFSRDELPRLLLSKKLVLSACAHESLKLLGVL